MSQQSEKLKSLNLKNKQAGKEEMRVKLKLFETCYMQASLTYSLEVWAAIKKEELKAIEKLQSKILKCIFKLLIATTSAVIWMDMDMAHRTV